MKLHPDWKKRGISLRQRRSYKTIRKVILLYARRFHVRVSRGSIQNDHIHLLLRCRRRSRFQDFFRVVAGQIAQKLGIARTSFWKHRLWTRVVRGRRALKTVMAYIRLNEWEVRGWIPYSKNRLRGLTREQRRKIEEGREPA